MKPQKLSIVNGRRTTIDFDSRTMEYQAYNKTRWRYNKETMQFYNSSIWRKTSKQVLLANNYVCAVCGGEATMTDHIVSVKKDWSKRLEWDNLQPICKTCNDAKGSWN
jgi:5-methylcytosine-specific restriction endonuclease McrA